MKAALINRYAELKVARYKATVIRTAPWEGLACLIEIARIQNILSTRYNFKP